MAAKKYFAAKALVNITHNLKSYKIGETLKLTVEESKEFEGNDYVEMIDELPTKVDSKEEGDGNADPNTGGEGDPNNNGEGGEGGE